jgi:hypothetical protein
MKQESTQMERRVSPDIWFFGSAKINQRFPYDRLWFFLLLPKAAAVLKQFRSCSTYIKYSLSFQQLLEN